VLDNAVLALFAIVSCNLDELDGNSGGLLEDGAASGRQLLAA
jgi:hypothetical protein